MTISYFKLIIKKKVNIMANVEISKTKKELSK